MTPPIPPEARPFISPHLIHGLHGALPEHTQVWHFQLNPDEQQLSQFNDVLNDQEKERAERYTFERHRRRFTACRAQVRQLLAREVDVAPESLVFALGEHGKPRLEQGGDLTFNVSDSGDHGVLALSRASEVGVDLEYLSPELDCDAIAHRYFSQAEVRSYRAVVDDDKRRETFFRLWSCKEAYIKAIGLGLAAGLGNFDIELAPGQAAGLGDTRGKACTDTQWSLYELAGPAGFCTAIVLSE